MDTSTHAGSNQTETASGAASAEHPGEAAPRHRAMRVALAFHGCYRRGGVERITLECANFLASRGHETHVFASEWDVEALDSRVQRHQVESRGGSFLARLRSYVPNCRADYGRMEPRADVLGAFGAVSPPGGVCWVQSVHAAWLSISSRERNWKGRLRQKLNPFHAYAIGLEQEYFGGRKYKHLIALSPQVRDDLARFYNVPAEDVTIIPNGFAPGEFNLQKRRDQRQEMREKLGFGESDRVVIFVANELERKGFGPLLRAIASLQRPEVHLLAVGRLDAGSCAREIEQLGMTSRVQFTGPSSDVASYYAAADVFALPTYYEAWGLVIVEAMACGLPVLTSRLAGASVAVREGQAGALLDDPHDTAEIAAKLRPLLEGGHSSPHEIAASVEEYAWPRVLLAYEATLARHADLQA
jgi:UDP-glucose:(heptosyl)LPS alpha-1,3-glucosyltransferase